MKKATWMTLLLVMLAPVLRAAELNEADVRAVCAKFQAPPSSKATQVTDADRKLFAQGDCRSYFYAAPETNRDYDKGRRCCLVTSDCNRELAMLFANGWGTPRDYDAATHFLCKEPPDSGETWGMLGHLQAMRQDPNPKDLLYCDWVTSGAGMGMCAGQELDAKRPEWDRRIADVARSLSPEAQTALKALRKVAKTFVEKDLGLLDETTRGGTGHASFLLSGELTRTETFVAHLERHAANRAPAATAEALAQADRDLNATYQGQLAELKTNPDLPKGPQEIREAQRAWIQYRDAWTAFYRLRWKGAAPPEALDREIATALTTQRAADLRKGTDE
jgi:uncharacterized protein YecT (DUF1311 family)